MLFKPQLIDKIVTGGKTQTRRPFNEGEYLKSVAGKMTWFTAKGRIKYQVGKTYAVQPGRGLATVRWHPALKVTIMSDAFELVLAHTGTTLTEGFEPLRIHVLDIFTEDVREISCEDALAEGFTKQAEFMATWCNFYDKRHAGAEVMPDKTVLWVDAHGNPYADDVVDFPEWLMLNRPSKPYRGGAIKFEIAS